MNHKVIAGLILTLFSSVAYSHAFNCNIKNVTLNSSTSGLVYVAMGCAASSPFDPTIEGCTADTISPDTVVFDGSTEQGKMYYSLALAAFVAQKNVLVSAYATCPTESESTPVVYSMKVSN